MTVGAFRLEAGTGCRRDLVGCRSPARKRRRAAAEMVAALYDASLDAYLPHQWSDLQLFRTDYSTCSPSSKTARCSCRPSWDTSRATYQDVMRTLSAFPERSSGWNWTYGSGCRAAAGGQANSTAPWRCWPLRWRPRRRQMADGWHGEWPGRRGVQSWRRRHGARWPWRRHGRPGRAARRGGEPASAIDLSKVSARQNLNETAFFFPHLMADAEGSVTMKFTMPEA